MIDTKQTRTRSDAAAAAQQIPLSVPSLDGREWDYVRECLDSNWVSSVGPFVTRFEEMFASAIGAKHAVACASGTAALHLAMRIAGVAAQDEVFVPTLTFVASLNPVLYEHASPVLVDSEQESWNVDANLIAEEIRRRDRLGQRLPKAVEVVHLLGHPADIEPIVDVSEEFGIVVIEDAAEALGAQYTTGQFAGRQVGTIGAIGCFSFNGNKIMTCGGGGMLVTDDRRLADRARHLSTQARVSGSLLHDDVGYNYRMANVAAALGLAQLERLPALLARKRAIAERYDRAFRDVPGIALAPRTGFAAPSFWLYSIAVDSAAFGVSRDALIERLAGAGIEARAVWPPLHSMPVYAGYPRLGGRVSESIAARALSLPSSVSMTAAEQDRVIDVVCS